VFPNQCLGDLQLASPLGYLGPKLAAMTGGVVYAGKYGQDVILALGQNQTDASVPSDKATQYEQLFQAIAQADGGTLSSKHLLKLLLDYQVPLHSLTDSYLSDHASDNWVITQLQQMIPAVSASCAAGESVASSIVVSPVSASIAIGKTVAFVAAGYNSLGGLVGGQSVQWSTDHSAVATVSSAGVVTGVAAGTATITATIGGTVGSATVTVTAAPSAIAPTAFLLAPGNSRSCALDAAGHAYCWGMGRLGNGSPTYSYTPVPVSGGNVFTTIVSGSDHACALTINGTAMCWGLNGSGQLGDGTTTDRDAPVPVAGSYRFVSIFAGNASTCALLNDGTAYCWGFNRSGGLGNGQQSEIVSTPTSVLTNLRFIRLAVGDVHTCGLTINGTAYCWGDNGSGQLGVGAVSTACSWTVGPYQCALTPDSVQTLQKFSEIVAGALHTCALTAAGTTYCWGLTQGPLVGQVYGLGDGTAVGSLTPITVASGWTFKTITSGAQHTCALTAAGKPFCWGDNTDGALGSGGGAPGSLVPAAVSGGYTFSTIASKNRTSCGRLASDGTTYCWGSGPLGDGAGQNSFSNIPVPVQIP
jgi:alpha-tubulin suppressor-like RCC1 family protein